MTTTPNDEKSITAKNPLHSPEDSTDNIHQLHGHIPWGKALFFGFQHVVAMFVGNLTPILLIAAVAQSGGKPFTAQDTANLVQATMLAAGIATLMQVFPVWKIGSRLPVVMGTSFAFIGGGMVIAAKEYSILVGAIIVSGFIEGLLGLCVPLWRKMITSLVAGLVIFTIGISLFSACVFLFAGSTDSDAGSWVHISIATITLIACQAANIRFKGVWQQLNLLFGLLVGYACAILATITGLCPLIDFTETKLCLSNQSLLCFPSLLPYTPSFEWGSIVAFTIICITSAVQTIGTVEATCQGVLYRPATEREIGGAVCCDGFSNSVVGWLFGCLPVTTYEQNIGVLMVSRAVNLRIITAGSLILIAAGLIPALGSFLSTLPSCVLGGCLVMVFGSITYIGIQMIYEAGLCERNLIITSVSLCIGLGSSAAPKLGTFLPDIPRDILLSSPVTLVFIISVLLTLFLPQGKGTSEELTANTNNLQSQKE